LKYLELDNKEKYELLLEFYNYFYNGFVFEDFLKTYLQSMGLDEVAITQKTRDGGYDLTAIRKGIGEFSESDLTYYFIQAKCYKCDKSIGVRYIRELKGTIPFGHKGIFITTAKFSKDAIEEAKNDPSKPIILIDGISLIESCIEHDLGFIYKPVFSKQRMEEIMENTTIDVEDSDDNIFIEKKVTSNDIRASILRVPKLIFDNLPIEQSTLKVSFESNNYKNYNIDSSRCYIGGVTSIFKKFGLKTDDGIYIPKKSIWKFNKQTFEVEIIFKENN